MTICPPGYAGETCAPWATEADMPSPCDASLDSDVLTLWRQVASDILFNLTGRRWPGECTRIDRPCRGGCFAGRSSPWPFRDAERRCGCTSLSRVRLTGTPVATDGIVEVLVDGEVVDPAEYMVQNGRHLVGLRQADGILRRWPNCQYEELPTTEVGTWSVEYHYGTAPPLGGVRAAGQLGCQLALSTNPQAVADGRCRLPKRVTTITRQGVTLAVLDTFALFKDGLTGLSEVDLWISSIRYGDKGRRASMSDPGRI